MNNQGSTLRTMDNNDIRILVTGDLCPINRIEKLAMEKNFAAVFNDYIDILQGNDLITQDPLES